MVYPYEPLTCQEVIEAGFTLPTDIYPDCRIDLADFAEIAIDWMACNDPENPNCESTW